MALGEKRNGSVFATAAQRRDAAEYQVTSEPEIVPVVLDDTPQRTLNTDIGTLRQAHNLFFTPSAEGRDFNSVLQEVQEYISGAYAALITGGGEDSKEQLMRYITKYLQDKRMAVAGMTQTELVDAIYSEMAEFGFLTRYIYADGIEEINIYALPLFHKILLHIIYHLIGAHPLHAFRVIHCSGILPCKLCSIQIYGCAYSLSSFFSEAVPPFRIMLFHKGLCESGCLGTAAFIHGSTHLHASVWCAVQ